MIINSCPNLFSPLIKLICNKNLLTIIDLLSILVKQVNRIGICKTKRSLACFCLQKFYKGKDEVLSTTSIYHHVEDIQVNLHFCLQKCGFIYALCMLIFIRCELRQKHNLLSYIMNIILCKRILLITKIISK